MKTYSQLAFVIVAASLLVVPVFAQTNPAPVELIFRIDTNINTDSYLFGAYQCTTPVRSNAWACYAANPATYVKRAAEDEQKMAVVNAMLSTNEIGPIRVTTTSGLLVHRAYLYRVNGWDAMYRVQGSASGGKVPLASLPKELQGQLGYDPAVAIAKDFELFRKASAKARARGDAEFSNPWAKAQKKSAREPAPDGMPTEVFNAIKRDAARQWPEDYDMQRVVIQMQVAAWQRLQREMERRN